ncbi:MAG: hypothetical protein ACTSPM_02525 [Candidatus Heimdallarchaeota archaeon]
MSELEKKLEVIEERMKEQLSSSKDAKLIRTLMETLIDIREAFEEFNRFFKIEINLEELETFKPREVEYSGEWTDSLIKICEVLIGLYEKIDKKDLAEKWQKRLAELKEIN